MEVPDNYIVLRSGRFDSENGAGAPGLARAFSHIATTKPSGLVIYLHGGLVSRETGEAAASTLNPLFVGSGASPLFLIWETGVTEVIDQNVTEIFNEEIFKRIVRRVTQFVKGKLDKSTATGFAIAKSVVDLPLPREDLIKTELDKAAQGDQMFADVALDQFPSDDKLSPDEEQQIRAEIESDGALELLAQQIANSRQILSEVAARDITARGSIKSLMSPEVLDDIAPVEEGSKGLLSMAMLAKHVVVVVGAVIWRFAKRRDHGIYLTIVEEISREFYARNAGKFLWDGIKNEVDEAFGIENDCGGTALVKALTELWTNGVKPQVTLVGHSAGAIYVSRLLKELNAKLPADFKVNVIFIAPACTFPIFAEALDAAGHRVAGLRIFGMADRLELEDAIAGRLYPASLLYFVSGVLENERDMPLLGMQRYYAPPYEGVGFEAIALVRAFSPLTRKNAFVWAEVSEGDGANCDMTSHGGWIQEPATRASVLYIVKNGFNYA